MEKEQLLKAMAIMVSAKDWQGYLHFRRMLFTNYRQDFNLEVRQLLKSLSEEDLDAYVKYFGIFDLPKPLRHRYKKPTTPEVDEQASSEDTGRPEYPGRPERPEKPKKRIDNQNQE